MSETSFSIPDSGVYYVSINGSDANKGTKNKPYKTLKKAVSKLKAGDTLVIRKGIYKETLDLFLHGKQKSYITIQSYPGEKVVLYGIGKGDNTVMVKFNDFSYVRLHGLELRNRCSRNY